MENLETLEIGEMWTDREESHITKCDFLQKIALSDRFFYPERAFFCMRKKNVSVQVFISHGTKYAAIQAFQECQSDITARSVEANV